MSKDIRGTITWEIPPATHIEPADLALTILQRRAYTGIEPGTFLDPNYQSLADPFGLPDMQPAVDHILSLRGTTRRVVIYGDYDIDGMTATALLVDVLAQIGIAAEPYIPDRFVEGYGLHTAALLELAQQGVDTVITVDCGSTAHEQIAAAVAAGLHIIVTDHHTLGTEPLEGAVAHINPLRQQSSYPESRLAGVGVAFTLARALQQAVPDKLPSGQEKWLLDLVALGTICDVVPLQGENRILARFGLAVLRQTRRVGIKALAQVAGVELPTLRGDDVGFKFGPRLNAAGRLVHARQALELLMTNDMKTAQQLAQALQSLNQERQAQTAAILAAAREQAVQQDAHSCLVVAHGDWSHGVVGLVASRLVEEFRKPALVLQIEGETAKGSGRSIGDFRLIDALQSQAKLLKRFGGHAAAAGLTIATKNLLKLQAGLEEYIQAHDAVTQFHTTVVGDAWLQPEFLSEVGLQELARLEPFGNSHSQPLFYLEGTVASLRPVGADGQHYQLIIEGSAGRLRTIAFGAAQAWPWLEVGAAVEAMIKLNASIWRGMTRPDCVVSYIRPALTVHS